MGFSKGGGGGGCKIGREERMRAILTWVLVVVVCARQEPPGRELGAAALRLSIFPTSYLAHTTPKQLHPGLLKTACFSILLSSPPSKCIQQPGILAGERGGNLSSEGQPWCWWCLWFLCSAGAAPPLLHQLHQWLRALQSVNVGLMVLRGKRRVSC